MSRPLNFTIGRHFLANMFSGFEKTETFFLMGYLESLFDTHSLQHPRTESTPYRQNWNN
jgi:hypothetical protein